MNQLPSMVSLIFLIFFIFLATSRISLRMSDFLLTPSHLLIFWTSLGGEPPLFSGRGLALISELTPANANQTETGKVHMNSVKVEVFWEGLKVWQHLPFTLALLLKLLSIYQIQGFNFLIHKDFCWNHKDFLLKKRGIHGP